MWRARTSRAGVWLAVALAVFSAFLLGNWQTLKFRAADLSAAEKVALRFPETDLDQPIAASAVGTAPMVMGSRELALFSPEPVMPDPRLRPSQPQPAAFAASLPAGEDASVHSAPPPRPVPVAIPVAPKREVRPATVSAARSAQRADADAAPRRGSRPGFLLNDAQIASIKSRLHLSPDQETMWPAVEAALRNIAYAKAQTARPRGGDRGADVAALDPDSAAVQGLKSAAVPLIMSFSDDQKNEVRSLAHVMGLDKLAAEF